MYTKALKQWTECIVCRRLFSVPLVYTILNLLWMLRVSRALMFLRTSHTQLKHSMRWKMTNGARLQFPTSSTDHAVIDMNFPSSVIKYMGYNGENMLRKRLNLFVLRSSLATQHLWCVYTDITTVAISFYAPFPWSFDVIFAMFLGLWCTTTCVIWIS